MSLFAKEILAKLARKFYANPAAANRDDVKKLAAGLLLLIEGKIPK